MGHKRRETDKLENLTEHDLLIKTCVEMEYLCKTFNKLEKKLDNFIAPDGSFMQVKTFQAGCPRFSFKTVLKRQWGALGIMASAIIAVAVKAFSGNG